MPDEVFDLSAAFYSKQASLLELLTGSRKVATHPVAKGDGSELHWRKTLRKFLPKRYGVSKGFVVDSAGGSSKQIDVIIHDCTYSPLLWEDGGHLYVPAESVYAVFEIKQDLSLDHIKAAAQKATSVRSRVRTRGEFGWLKGTDTKELTHILAGLLATDAEWTPAFGDPFYRALEGLDAAGRLDLGCVLGHGSWDLDDYTNPKSVQLSVKDAALISFCMNLLRRLQKLGTVGGIDYRAYERNAGLTREH